MGRYVLLKHLSDYPVDREQGWSDKLQGVTHDDSHWYITQRYAIWKIPASLDLNEQMNGADQLRGIFTESPLSKVFPGYNHLGDLDYQAGRLYVAVEDVKEEEHEACIGVFNAGDLSFIASAILPSQGPKGPWCAINPLDGLLYSSHDNDVDCVFAYDHEVAYGELHLSLHHVMHLLDPDGNLLRLNGIQGGVFTADGTLYLASNADETRGVLVFSTPEGVLIQRQDIPSDRKTYDEEIEGLTFWDLDYGQAPHMRGQLHVLEADNDWLDGHDDLLAFRHYRVGYSPFIANRNPACREVHRWDCQWIDKMYPHHKVPYDSLEQALTDGYDGCYYCLPEQHTR